MTSIKNGLKNWLLPLSAYLGMTLAVTWPLALHFNDYVIGGGNDGPDSVWNIWWIKFALTGQGQSLFDCYFRFFPDGVNLTFHWMPKMLGILGIPLQQFLSLGTAYNLLVVLTLVASGLTAYRLLLHLLPRALPAFLAGAFFAFSPYRLGQISYLNLLATMLIPVYILLIIRAKEALAQKVGYPWMYFGLAGVVLALTSYDTEHYAIFLVIFSIIFLFFYRPSRKDQVEHRQWLKLITGLAATMAIAVILFSPMLVAAARELSASGDIVTSNTREIESLSSDALSFFIPEHDSDLLVSRLGLITNRIREPENSYIGLVILALAFTGLWRYRKVKEARLWVYTALVFAILALGPTLRIYGGFTHIPMPYMLINRLPLINTIRTPSRYVAMVSLAVAILAGYGSNAIFDRLKKYRYAALSIPLVAVLLIASVYFETTTRTNLISTEVPSVYQEVAGSKIQGSVISMPFGWQTATTGNIGRDATFVELYQPVHERPMAGGMVSRAPAELVYGIANSPVLDYLANPGAGPSAADLDPKNIDESMQRFQIAFIIVHKLYPWFVFGGESFRNTAFNAEELKNIDQYITKNLPMEKFEETDEIVAYRRV